ncbi:hypothetical protein J0683_24960, partial [Vibrio parahaemolyticus]|uniref:hypothetical protein n=1 Tax=Vibrio parahaemolyticus TaxID=670 RepID=UPI001A8CA5F6|nr:hypothetical protein [Vibrio parahaemolyticus]
YDSLCGEDKELSHHHISCLRNGELTERMDEYLAKGVRQQGIIKNQDLKACGLQDNLLHCHFFDLLIFEFI